MEIEITIEAAATAKAGTLDPYAINYCNLLDAFGVKYKPVGYHFQVGEMDKTQGWILHLSAVLYLVDKLLQVVVPYLISEQVSFKIPMNLTTAEDILSGNLGTAQIGKIVSIYPEDDSRALYLAKHLIDQTQHLKGPAVPTDFCLGNIVYTLFGSFAPITQINEKGDEETYTYSPSGQLIPDSYSIPFHFPEGIKWPFNALAEPVLPEPPKYFNRIYKILSTLKSDCRGNVYQGLYLKNLFTVKKCVLKQGFANSDSDIFGRDIRDKLLWQAKSHKELFNEIPVPKLYDFIQEDAYSLLVMQYIDGDSLYQKVQDLNPFCTTWPDLPLANSKTLLSYVIQIAEIISRFHKMGYVHRDIMPVNFLINQRNRVFIIDLELAYSLLENKPVPPFRLGTPGFASPEQMQTWVPRIDQDIYSLGAVLLWLFTGLTPIKFTIENENCLSKNLNFFIRDDTMSSMIASCLSKSPGGRPAIVEIQEALDKYKIMLTRNSKNKTKTNHSRLLVPEVYETINAALIGLTHSPVISSDDFWYSKKTTTENRAAAKSKQYTRQLGIAEGMTGPLYLLSKLHGIGIQIDSCKFRFQKAWNYIEDCYINQLPNLSPGLYYGAAGLAVTIWEGINSGLLDPNKQLYKQTILKCLSITTDKLDLAFGVAGQGIALLRCRSKLPETDYNSHLALIVDKIVLGQQANGLWPCSPLLDIAQGSVGILWFLLEYLSIYPDNKVQQSIERGLAAILNSKRHMNPYMNVIGTTASYDITDGGTGLILLSIKAYQALGSSYYKKIAQNALLKYPPRVVHTNFTQQNGLSGLGEIYLEAWQVFGEDEWKKRADWVTDFFLHTFCRVGEDSGYWMLEEHNLPAADFLEGLSGIIYFLARSLRPDKLGYRLLK